MITLVSSQKSPTQYISVPSVRSSTVFQTTPFYPLILNFQFPLFSWSFLLICFGVILLNLYPPTHYISKDKHLALPTHYFDYVILEWSLRFHCAHPKLYTFRRWIYFFSYHSDDNDDEDSEENVPLVKKKKSSPVTKKRSTPQPAKKKKSPQSKQKIADKKVSFTQYIYTQYIGICIYFSNKNCLSTNMFDCEPSALQSYTYLGKKVLEIICFEFFDSYLGCLNACLRFLASVFWPCKQIQACI